MQLLYCVGIVTASWYNPPTAALVTYADDLIIVQFDIREILDYKLELICKGRVFA